MRAPRSLRPALPFLLISTFAAADPISFVDLGASGEHDLGDGHGTIAVIDYDDDGYPDIVAGGAAGEPIRLFHNEPKRTNPGRRAFVDVSAGSGLDDVDGSVRSAEGVVVADYDNDDDDDIFITGYRVSNHSHGLLYRNDGGGSFTNVSQTSGVRIKDYRAESASWTDYDLDGFVDLLICNWGAGSLGNFRLLHNEGNGTFSNATQLLPPIPGFINTIFAHLWMDYDRDGYADAFIPSDHGPPVVFKNVADGAGGRTFVNVANAIGFGGFSAYFPMGIAAGDKDGDGDLDLGISTIGHGAYFENLGGTFAEIFPFEAIWGWGVDWLDADNDTDLDFYMAGSFNPDSGLGAAPDVLFENLADGSFLDASSALNGVTAAGKNSIQVDFNNDGRQDLITCNPGIPGESVSVYENVSDAQNNWIKIRLRGAGVGRSNTDAIGAVVQVRAAGKTQVAEVISGSSTTATEDLRLHFGLGSATRVTAIRVIWPRQGTLGARTRVYRGPFEANRIVTLHEPVLGQAGKVTQGQAASGRRSTPELAEP